MNRKRAKKDVSDDEQEINENFVKRARKTNPRKFPDGDDDLVCILCSLCNQSM